MKRKIGYYLSLVCLVINVISWLPYLVFDIQKPYGMVTFAMGPAGFFLGSFANSRFLALGNLVMMFSFILAVLYVYLKKGYIPM